MEVAKLRNYNYRNCETLVDLKFEYDNYEFTQFNVIENVLFHIHLLIYLFLAQTLCEISGRLLIIYFEGQTKRKRVIFG